MILHALIVVERVSYSYTWSTKQIPTEYLLFGSTRWVLFGSSVLSRDSHGCLLQPCGWTLHTPFLSTTKTITTCFQEFLIIRSIYFLIFFHSFYRQTYISSRFDNKQTWQFQSKVLKHLCIVIQMHVWWSNAIFKNFDKWKC